MQLGNTVHFNSFKWVKEELRQLLLDIQRQLEIYVNNQEDVEKLDQIISSLRQVRGTLSLVEVYGAALLSEEMEMVARALKTDEIPNRENAYDVLLSAAIKLPDYLEGLASGNKDVPMVLLPLLNDLRACRNASLLSENVLFFPDISAATGSYDAFAGPVGDDAANESCANLARKLRHSYQLGLLGWFRDQKTKDAFDRMHSVVNKLGNAARHDTSRRLWWVAIAIIEALQHDGVEASVALKSLMGKVDRQIKQLAELDESDFVKVLPEELTKNLLYYAARSEPVTDTVANIKSKFNLSEYLPGQSEIESAEDRLGGPNQELLNKVSAAIIEDISQAKDTMEMYIHGDRSDTSKLQLLIPLFAKIADTLGMLGLGRTRESLLQGKAQLEEQLAVESEFTEDMLMSAAGMLLTVENELDAYVNRRVDFVSAESHSHNNADSSVDTQVIVENQHVITTLVNESLRDLVLVKDAFLNFIDSPEDLGTINLVPNVLKELLGAMFIPPLDNVAPVIEQLKSYFDAALLQQKHKPNSQEQDTFADVVTNIECFLEAIAENRTDHDVYVNAAKVALERLRDLAPVPGFLVVDQKDSGDSSESDTESLPSQLQGEPRSTDELVIEESELSGEDPIDAELAFADESTESPFTLADSFVTKPAKKNYDDLQIIGEDADEEIIEVFIEEAVEELEKVSGFFPVWKTNPGDREAITTIRRSFHTLKGSGRLIGATLIGEFSWAMENMLNRLIDGAIKESPAMFNVLEESLGIMPQLIEQIRGNTTPVESAFDVMKRAEAVAAGQIVEDLEEIQADPDDGDDLLVEFVSSDLTDENDEQLLDAEEQEDSSDGPDMLAAVVDTRGTVSDDLDENVELVKNAEAYLDETSLIAVSDIDVFAVNDEDENISSHEEGAAETAVKASITEEQVVSDFPPPDLTGEYLKLEIDPTLLDIFSDEAQTHLTEISRISEKARHSSLSPMNIEGLIRALHTLHGSARTARFSGIAEKAKLLEQHANNLSDLNKNWSTQELNLLDRAVGSIGNSISHLKDHTTELHDDSNLTQQISDCLTRSENELSQSRQYGREKTGIIDSLEIDDELIEIFLEEAPEIVGTIEQELQAWKNQGQSPEHIAEIMRQLHTIKGSARMAGLADIGDLSHALESLFVAISTGRITVNSTLTDVLMEVVDLLGGMLDGLRQGIMPAVSKEYIEQLERLLHGSTYVESPAEENESAIEPEQQALEEPSSEVVPAPAVLKDFELDLGLPSASIIPFDGKEEDKEVVDNDERAAEVPVEQISTTAPLHEQIRVRAEKLDNLVNNAGEVNIYHSRLGQYINNLNFNLSELEQTVSRLQGQLRDLDVQTEAQIASRIERESEKPYEEFDPLEMDRYSHMQQLSRAMAESASDLDNIKGSIDELVRSSEVVLQQQTRVSTELQEELLQTRMVKFQGLASRLRRITRQTALQLDKKVELRISGSENEIDRSVQERMLAPLEHMLRNAVFHGIESTQERERLGKPGGGVIHLNIERDGSYIVLSVTDDGRGIDPTMIRRKAIELGLLGVNDQKSDNDIIQYILHDGFSTADDVSQIAGRGVGMDVVDSEIKQLGGNLSISSQPGKGSIFNIRLPLTLAINQALLVRLGEDVYAIPSASIEGVALLNATEVEENLTGERRHYEYAGADYDMYYLGALLGMSIPSSLSKDARYPLLLIRAGERRIGVHVDAMVGRREIVVKPVGPQITAVPGISGATILADGKVALILEVLGLVGTNTAEINIQKITGAAEKEEDDVELTIMVVDDSITIRKVTSRILGRHNLKVISAKDGLDAVQQLQDVTPDLFLMDIEMPRMDGFELATHVRSDSRLQAIPIIMITSRTGDKHRDRARKIGVDRYLGKPFQENELMNEINDLLERSVTA